MSGLTLFSILLLWLTKVCGDEEGVRYVQHAVSELTPYLEFAVSEYTSSTALPTRCAVYCSQYQACRFFRTVPASRCLLLSYGGPVATPVVHTFAHDDIIYGKTDMCLAGKCYHVMDGPHTWQEAVQVCANMDAYLVEINTQTQLDLVNAIALAEFIYGLLWLGGTDAAVPGEWVWYTSGKPFTVTNWLPYEPGLNSEHCVGMTRSHGGWNDRSCTDPGAALCWFP